mmetsp:Transcript_106155/g.236927  ORF Transcript_106155/g.236927 Transcript_106155/m.236927 type:complete len:278 (-) Transcript_106155:334-1167(-)
MHPIGVNVLGFATIRTQRHQDCVLLGAGKVRWHNDRHYEGLKLKRFGPLQFACVDDIGVDAPYAATAIVAIGASANAFPIFSLGVSWVPTIVAHAVRANAHLRRRKQTLGIGHVAPELLPCCQREAYADPLVRVCEADFAVNNSWHHVVRPIKAICAEAGQRNVVAPDFLAGVSTNGNQHIHAVRVTLGKSEASENETLGERAPCWRIPDDAHSKLLPPNKFQCLNVELEQAAVPIGDVKEALMETRRSSDGANVDAASKGPIGPDDEEVRPIRTCI